MCFIVLVQVSEGLDFADHAGRAVIVTGMPFATPTDPKVCIQV
jgi:regulator of telomere elongation helicase 1